MTMLADQVAIVIGVDTHKHTNTAAVVASATGGLLDERTVPTTLAGNEALLQFATAHGVSSLGDRRHQRVRSWADSAPSGTGRVGDRA